MDTGKSYEFIVQKNPEDEQGCFLGDHFPLNGEQIFVAKLLKKQKCKVSIAFMVSEEGMAVSRKELSYGGFWVDKKITVDSFLHFIKELVSTLNSMGIRELKLVQPPEIYEQNNPLIHFVLQNQGFSLEGMEMHHFLVDKKFIKGFVHAKLSKHKKKVKKMECAVEVGGIKNFNFLKAVKEWHTHSGDAYRIQEDALISQVGGFPERFFLISFLCNGESVAHALCVKLTDNSLSYHLSAFDPSFDHVYAMEGMMFEVIRLGESLGVDIIDLGTVITNGREGLKEGQAKLKYSNKISNKTVWAIQL
ncbi:hypothetical protein GCM10028791_15290 [Echinicola sediminis]